MAKIKDRTSVGKDVKKLELSLAAGRNVMVSPASENSLTVLQTLNIAFLYDSRASPLVICPRELKAFSYKNLYMNIHNNNKPKCLASE